MSRPQMFKKCSTETGPTGGGPRFRPDCLLCRQDGYRASDCPHKERVSSSTATPKKRAFGTYALGCAFFDTLLDKLQSCLGANDRTLHVCEEDR